MSIGSILGKSFGNVLFGVSVLMLEYYYYYEVFDKIYNYGVFWWNVNYGVFDEIKY